MKDTYESVAASTDQDDDSMRLDRGFTGVMAHVAQLFCIAVFFGMWPFLLWWTQF